MECVIPFYDNEDSPCPEFITLAEAIERCGIELGILEADAIVLIQDAIDTHLMDVPHLTKQDIQDCIDAAIDEISFDVPTLTEGNPTQAGGETLNWDGDGDGTTDLVICQGFSEITPTAVATVPPDAVRQLMQTVRFNGKVFEYDTVCDHTAYCDSVETEKLRLDGQLTDDTVYNDQTLTLTNPSATRDALAFFNPHWSYTFMGIVPNTPEPTTIWLEYIDAATFPATPPDPPVGIAAQDNGFQVGENQYDTSRDGTSKLYCYELTPGESKTVSMRRRVQRAGNSAVVVFGSDQLTGWVVTR